MNDAQLVKQIKTGDQQSLSLLYETHRSEFIRWIVKDFKCPDEDSKDLYQMAVLVVYDNIHKGKLDQLTSSLKTYLFGIGKNLAYERNRKMQKQQSFEPDLHLQQLATEDPDASQLEEKLDLVAACLKRIGPPCQELLEQFYFGRKSMDEITITLGYKNSDTAKTQKYKCMGRLRKNYEEEFAKQLT